MLKSPSLMNEEELKRELQKEKENKRKIASMCIHFGNLEFKRNSLYKKSEERILKLEEKLGRRGIVC